MKDPIKLKELIIEKLDISRIMVEDGVKFIFNPTGASEVQCKCPFHGKDNKPSARFYRSTNTFYCFKCAKAWNPISYIMEKEGFNFIQSINYLINRYNIDTSSISDDPDLSTVKPPQIDDKKVRMIYIRNKIREKRGLIPLDKYKALCFVYYMIYFKMTVGEDIIRELNKFESKL